MPYNEVTYGRWGRFEDTDEENIEEVATQLVSVAIPATQQSCSNSQ